MEKGVPGFEKSFNRYLSRLRAEALTAEEARRELTIWDAKYRERVTEGDSMFPGEGTYGGILDAYARREALKQYLEEVIK